ncbi:MAG: Fe-S cluster domain-containing protein [Selenomonadaceae bacterium]|nr:Fe-S cluster domain-containing protein [Selenomonadaceae bacterium]
MNTPVMIVVVLVGVGAFFGLVLALANKKFAMESNPLIEEVEDILPKGQCGACGFAGCQKYAEAVVEDPDVPPNLCVPGKAAVAEMVAKLTGKHAEAAEPQYAYIKCRGDNAAAKNKAVYEGVADCAAAKLVMGGGKACKYGCMGFGNCVKACHFHALEMGENGLPKVNQNLCTGCGACAKSCPQNIIALVSFEAKVEVKCSSKDKGAIAKKNCANACIGCGLCKRNCPHQAIEIVDNLAKVNTAICREKCKEADCVLKCPTKAIADLIIKS